MDFEQAYAGFQQLKQQFDSGQLAESDFKARLQELMVQDEQGCWWMIGRETGQWYRHDGTDWVRADPPAPNPPPAIPAAEPARLQPKHAVDAAATPRQAIQAGPIEVRPGWIGVLWITLGWLLVALLVDFVFHSLPELPVAVLAGALGGLFMALVLRGQGPVSRWKSLLWIVLGWSAGMYIEVFLSDSGLPPFAGIFVGGLATAFTLKSEGRISAIKDLAWISLAWPLAFITGAISGAQLGIYDWWAPFIIFSLIGSLVMTWRLRTANRSPL